MQTAEEEKAVRELGEKVGPSELGTYKSTEMEDLGKLPSSNGRYIYVYMIYLTI